MSESGRTIYSWPFYYTTGGTIDSVDLAEYVDSDNKKWKQRKKQKFSGVLTNMWAGCEPVCAIVSKLLNGGFFCSFPWNIGLGYMFRRNTPKLVFVFANEYDNSFRTGYDYYGGFGFNTVLVVPGADDTKVTFYGQNLGAVRDAVDPFCVKQLKTTDSTGSNIVNAFDKYMDEIGLSGTQWNTRLQTAIRKLVVDGNLQMISSYGYPQPASASTLWKVGNKVSDDLNVAYSGYSASSDLDNNAKPFAGMNVTQLLTPRQLSQLEETTRFPGIEYKTTYRADDFIQNQFLSSNYYVPKTVGFYQLRNTFCKVTEPYNTYMFVSDANSPTPLYDVDIDEDNPDEWWDNPENAKEVAKSLLLYEDSVLFDALSDVKVKKDIGEIFYKLKRGRDWDDQWDWRTRSDFPSWKDMMISNLGYFLNDKLVNLKKFGIETIAGGIYNDDSFDCAGAKLHSVFQSLRNPYTSTNIVLATRRGYNSFNSGPGNWSKANKALPVDRYPIVTETTKKNVTTVENAYLFMMGLPAGYTGLSAGMYEGWRKSYEAWLSSSTPTTQKEGINHFTNIILENVFGVEPPLDKHGEVDMRGTPSQLDFPWAEEIWHYATTGTRYDDENNHILKYIGVSTTDPTNGTVTVDGVVVVPKANDAVMFNDHKFKCVEDSPGSYTWIQFGHDGPDWYDDIGTDWIDTHLCPYPYWSGGSGRRASGKFCNGNCTEKSIENIAVRLCDVTQKVVDEETQEETVTKTSLIASDVYVLVIDRLFSGLSLTMKHDNGLWNSN